MRRLFLLVLLLAVGLPARAQSVLGASSSEGALFVYLGSFSSKASAQVHARLHDGWVLRSDLYRGLSPGYFAAVLGPFRTRADADEALAGVQLDVPGAFVREAGAPVLPPSLGDAALLAAVLGDLIVDVSAEPDDANPCAPTEPHLTVLVGFDQTQGADAPAAGFWVVERTGEIRPILLCDG